MGPDSILAMDVAESGYGAGPAILLTRQHAENLEPKKIAEAFCDPRSCVKRFDGMLSSYTPCFTDIVILGTAHLLAIITCGARLYQARFSRGPRYRLRGAARLLHVLGAVLSAAALLITVLLFNARLARDQMFVVAGPLAPYEWAGFGVAAVSHLLYIFTFLFDVAHYHTDQTWLWRLPLVLIAAGQIAKLRFVLVLSDDKGYFWVLYLIYVGIVVIQALIALFHWPGKNELEVLDAGDHQYELLADAEFHDKKVCPEATASVLSLVTFAWVGRLMRAGYKKPLQFEDIWDLPPDDQVDRLSATFRPIWQEQLHRRGGPSLTRALWRFCRYLILTAIPFKLVNDAAQFVGPLFLNLLLNVVSSGQPSYLGYSYAILMFVLLVIGTLSDNQHFQRVMRAGFRLRALLVHEVFDKVLFLTPSARARFTSGRVFNLVTSDTETLQMLFQNILGLMSSPLRIIGSVALLYQQLGPASLVAVATLVMFMPVQAVMVRLSARLLKKALTFTDERAKVERELLDGMDVVKCSAWENPFWDRIQTVRERELHTLWRSFLVAAINSFLLNAIPTFVSVTTFTVYVLLGNELPAAKAFTSLSLFSVLRMPLFQLPQLISQLVNAQVALNRLSEFLAAEEQGPMPTLPAVKPGETAVRLDGDFTWEESQPPALVGIDLSIKQGDLIAVVGSTGSGKSSLLAAALGLMQQVEGEEVQLHGKVAYVPQAAFIFNASVRDNILFGLPHDAARYERAIKASALDTDLRNMPAGDQTELGDKGLNVSGGQKQRIQIARAVYADSDVYMFDDPLSALDAKVAREVFNVCMAKTLRDKTRILVTNQLQFVNSADLIVHMSNGRIQERGTYEELLAKQGAFAQMMSGSEVEDKEEEDPADAVVDPEGAGQSGRTSTEGDSLPESRRQSAAGPRPGPEGANGQEGGGRPPGKGDGHLTASEGRSTGRVSWGVIRVYITAMGGLLRFGVLMTWFVLVELCRVGATVWLSYWTGVTESGPAPHAALWYLGIYAGISGGQTLFQLTSTYLLKYLSVVAARSMHNNMLSCLIRAPMAFFHTTPMGRIINRMTKDTADVDKFLADFSAFYLRSVLQLASTIVLIGVTTPFALPALVPILLLFYFLYQYFQASVREVKRLDSISRSPVYSSIGEALNGQGTIRAYKAEDRLSQRNSILVDNSVIMSLINQSMNRWLSIRLECLGALAALSAALLAIEQRGKASGMGLTLSYALSITMLTSITVRLASVAENSFNAVERISEYSNIPPEAPLKIPGRAPDDWPSSGEVRFEDVKMRYRPGLPLVLKGLSVDIPAGTTCGVVGRTGAGKTSLIGCLFRLMELDEGHIFIDKLDAGTLGLHQLRSRMAIIPQVPVLFTGSMRANLDPFEQHSDADIWAALRRSHLAGVVESNPLGLDMQLAEGGAPLSAGQKQLVALSRALLRNSKILVLDEATANVDVETDALIQKTVREEFKDRTIIAIAHRLHTIIDCDAVLVMENGRAMEYGPPAKLLENSNGTFSSMVAETGDATERFLRSVARGEVDHKQELHQRAERGLQRINTLREWQDDCSTMSQEVQERTQVAADLLKVCLAGLRDDAESQETRRELGLDMPQGSQDEEGAAQQSLAQALDLLAEVNSMAQQAQKLLVRRGQSNNATPRASITPRDTPNGSRRQSMGAGYRRDSTTGQGSGNGAADSRDEGQVHINIPSNLASPFADHTTQLLTPGARPGASASSPGAESPAAGLPPRHSAPLESNDSRRSLHSHRLPPIPSGSMQLQDSGGLDTPQTADGSEARRRWARLRAASRRASASVRPQNSRQPYSRLSREDPSLSHNPDFH